MREIPAHARLPLAFDAAAMRTEVDALEPGRFVAHFNTGYHDGGWSGAALRSPGGDASRLYADPSAGSPSSDTELMERCPAIAAALAQIRCPLRAVRVLRLAPGGIIREHRDDDLLWEKGEARLHIPLATHPEVEFYVDGTRVVMEAGECWYLDLSRPHRVQNRGATQRIHLVVDCVVNDWLATQVASRLTAGREPPQPSGQDAFLAFRERVLADEALQDALRAECDPDRFRAKCVELGRAHGFDFIGEDVRAAMVRGRQSWMSQWVF
jgi:hypothetical protein